jgi:2-polyprenyl-3-methyl-5-hydroxy-6-metoxy-1,4-benzoquinol methylase
LNAAVDSDQLFTALKKLPVDVVADVLNYIPPEYTKLREILPTMASDEVQTSWIGTASYPLLLQSCAFMRAVDGGMQRFDGRSIDGLDVLDYGCGWGRLIRLLYKYTPPERIYGVDPWDKSIDICKESGIRANLAVSDYLPKTLPFEGKKFDLIYAFSVFTHLSERAATMALAACRERIKNDGMMVITARPLSYWDYHVHAQN